MKFELQPKEVLALYSMLECANLDEKSNEMFIFSLREVRNRLQSCIINALTRVKNTSNDELLDAWEKIQNKKIQNLNKSSHSNNDNNSLVIDDCVRANYSCKKNHICVKANERKIDD